MKVGDYFEANFHTGEHEELSQPTGNFPPGIVPETQDPIDYFHRATISGTATKAGSYSVTIYYNSTLADGCKWTVTINWIVTN